MVVIFTQEELDSTQSKKYYDTVAESDMVIVKDLGNLHCTKNRYDGKVGPITYKEIKEYIKEAK